MKSLATMDVRDLRKVFPRSPNYLLGRYVILARTIDKCRANLVGLSGSYQWNCRLSKMFFEFTGVAPSAFRTQIKKGLTDNEMLGWIENTGTPRTEDEIFAWAYDCRWSTSATLELKARIEREAREISPNNLYIQSLFALIDIEEGRLAHEGTK